MVDKNREKILLMIKEIIERINSLDVSNPELMNLEIAMEDLRMVYRELELLKLELLKSFDLTKPEEEMPPAEDNTPERNIIDDEPLPVVPDEIETGQKVEETTVGHEVIVEQPQSEKAKESQPAPTKVNEADSVVSLDMPEGKPQPSNDELIKSVSNNHDQKSNIFVADKLRVDDNSIYKKFLMKNEDKSIGSRMQMTPVKSIKEAIGLNEKFIFINELFAGNIQDYYQSIDKLNEFHDAQGAFEYLNELGHEYNWDFERSENTIRMLVNLVQRRYLKG